MTQRKKVKESVFLGDEDVFATGLVDLIETLQEYVDKYGQDAHISHDFDYEYSCYDCRGDRLNQFCLVYTRDETDEEVRARLDKAAKSKAREAKAKAATQERARKKVEEQETEERMQLQRLLNKYGGG